MKEDCSQKTTDALLLSSTDIKIIRTHTFYPDSQRLIGIVTDGKVKLNLSREEIEDLQDYVAAESNHAEDSNIQQALDNIYDRLERYLVEYNDE